MMKIENKIYKSSLVTNPPAHHFFGFHDLPQWNHAGDMMLALRVDSIDHPPLPDQKADSGVILYPEREFIPIHVTSAFNYPQGARQQWIGSSDLFVCNIRRQDHWGANVVDARDRKVINVLDFPIHCLDNQGHHGFFVNYSRLHRLGGYGYVGVDDHTSSENIPNDCGIYKGDIRTNKYELLVSILECARIGAPSSRQGGRHHYLTHLSLSPSGNRLAFLHRYLLPDGGLTTRLMTVGVDGDDLRVLAKGFLSHFDWLDDGRILIWGRIDEATRNLRELPIFWLPGGDVLARTAKKILKQFIKPGTDKKSGNAAFFAIEDNENPNFQIVGARFLKEDGHPMVCPADRHWMVIDTYPDNEGWRKLMLYNMFEDHVVDLGRYQMITKAPDWGKWNQNNALPGVEPLIVQSFGEKKLIYTRSGLHCDLHPRWHPKGKAVAFDSIHEGTRQIYVIDFFKDDGVL
ncbi:hypothetical protein MIT9_P1843 [Methylomarinovum caldicuralii]|uniref:Uncharacterized protein n=1 Tax=Methylomarinovum caldicuralii TaxID=438856 RepID=A0AAU9CRV4_9GAMM|nr:hypothetical protein [Methylomarinovum caldicuralii]BCX82257.1 hypothetical protein MIT9_P1843 [Methylomarinovum caldicuralii]